MIDYFESNDFLSNLNKIQDWMFENNTFHIDSDYTGRRFKSGHYDHTSKKVIKYPISVDLFDKITGAITKYNDYFLVIDNSNLCTYREYSGWIVKYVHGQESGIILELDKKSVRNKKIENLIK